MNYLGTVPIFAERKWDCPPPNFPSFNDESHHRPPAKPARDVPQRGPLPGPGRHLPGVGRSDRQGGCLAGHTRLPSVGVLRQLCGNRRLQIPASAGNQETRRKIITMAEGNGEIDRRGFLGTGVRVAGAVGLGGVAGLLVVRRGQAEDYVWQIDPDKCVACDKCQILCVLDTSAVKCVQCFPLCGYCDVCTGYFPTTDFELNTAAENQLCPTGAIVRTFIEDQAGVRYFEYTIEEALCVGCAKCVKGCELMNGSLYMQVRHDLCVSCNECAIAVGCHTQAFYRVPASRPVLLKKKAREALESRKLHLSGQIEAAPSRKKARELEAAKKKVQELLDKDARDDIVEQRVQNG